MSVLVVAAHPDDEVLGVGGTIARHADDGEAVHVLILATGATSRGSGQGTAEIHALERAASAAAKVLGARPPRFGGFPDNRMDSVDLLDVVKAVEAAVDELRPHTVYTHHGGDLNVDHRIVHQAVMTAARPLPGCSVRALYAFETVSSTEWASAAVGPPFRPDRFVDVAAALPRKLQALGCYAGEMRPFPHARSTQALEALARWRGASVGLEAAEAFTVLRQLA